MDPLLQKVVGRALPPDAPNVHAVRLRQRGTLRLSPRGAWRSFDAEQVILARGTSFTWSACVRFAPWLVLRVVDSCAAGRGSLEVRLGRLLRLARATGPDVDAGETLRYLAELPWCPFALLHNPELTVAAFDGTRLSVAARGHELDLTVDAEGDVVAAHAAARPRRVGGSVVATPWSGSFADHTAFGGVRVPTRAAVSWHLAEGAFEYFRGEVVDLRALDEPT